MDLASPHHRIQWSGYLLEISKILNIKKHKCSIVTTLLPIRRSATDADIEIFGSDVVLR